MYFFDIDTKAFCWRLCTSYFYYCTSSSLESVRVGDILSYLLTLCTALPRYFVVKNDDVICFNRSKFCFFLLGILGQNGKKNAIVLLLNFRNLSVWSCRILLTLTQNHFVDDVAQATFTIVLHLVWKKGWSGGYTGLFFLILVFVKTKFCEVIK